jgi:hypothetical protein
MAGGFYANLDGRWWCESNRGLLQRSATAPLTSRGLEPLRRLQTTSMLTHIKNSTYKLGQKELNMPSNRPQAMVEGKIYMKRILSLATDDFGLSL